MTTYAHIAAGAIDQVGALPRLWFDGSRWWDYRADSSQAGQSGWLPLVEVTRPADTGTTTTDLTFTLVDGKPTQVWTVRPWTTAELAARAAESTRVSLDDRVRAAVASGGTLDVDLGSAGTPWTPGTALTLRGMKAMSQAQMKALTLAQTQELLGKLAPLLVDVAVATKRAGKLGVQLYDDAT